MGEEIPAQRLRRDQPVYGVFDQRQPLEGLRRQLLDFRQIDAVVGAERSRRRHGTAQLIDQGLLVPDRVVPTAARAIDCQRLLQRGEDVGVIHDDAAVLALEHAVGAGDGLHQRVIAHRLVEIDRRAAGRIEAGQPHGADENEPQRIGWVLELLLQAGIRVFHALAMRRNVEAQLRHLRDLVLGRRYDQRHVGGLENLQARRQFVTVRGGQIGAGQFALDAGCLCRPVPAHLVVHFQRRRLVDGHHHRLAQEAAPEKMPDDVLRHGFKPVIAGQDVILAAQLAFELCLLFVVQACRFYGVVDLFVEVGVDQAQFGRAVLVVERNRRAIGHRLLEVVDRDVIAEHIPGALLAGDQRRAREGQELRPGQCRAHVEGQSVVLAAMRLVGKYDDVGPVAEAVGSLKLVDQSEDVAMVFAQQLAQLRTAGCVAFIGFAGTDRADGAERLGDLHIQLDTVGDHDKAPVAGHFAHDLLGEKHHRIAFAAALGLPEHAGAAVAPLAGLQHRSDGVVDAKELVVLPQDFDQPFLLLGEKGEVLDQVEQTCLVAGAAQQDFQRHAARLVLALDPLPLEEAVPIGGQGTDTAV